MDKIKIDNFIKKLEADISRSEVKVEQSENLLRLKEVAALYRGEDKIQSFDKVAEQIKANKDELKMMSRWTQFDDIVKGFRLQQLVVVSALTKSGKTSFLMDLTSRFADYHPLWFPFEESAEELIRKFIERDEKPPHGFTPVFLKSSTIEWIEMRIIESIAKFNTKVVIIDQLDFIVPFGGDNHALRVGEAMRALKSIAKKWNICIFIICHLVKTKMDTQPTLEDLKGSSSIGQEADTVIILWREMYRDQGRVIITNNVNVSVQANRRTGSTGNVKMVFVNGHFLEQDWQRENFDIDSV